MTDIDNLVDQILAKNTAKRAELVVRILKSHGLDAVHVSDSKYKIVHAYNRQYKAKDATIKTKELLLHGCPELRIKNVVEARAEYYKSVVEFEVD